MKIMRLRTTTKMIIDAQQLAWFYHVNYMIKELIVVCVYRGSALAELVCRSLHDLVQDACYIFVPAQIFLDGKCLVFNFSRCPGATGCMPSMEYIRGPR